MSPEALKRRQRANTAEPGKGRESRQINHRNIQVASFFRWKGYVERPLAAVLLVATSPVVAVLWLLVKWTSPGPGIFRQQRVGLHGKPFHMLKLRSMCNDAETGSGAVWSKRVDPRVTPLGSVLRKLHLDELPQLWNVAKGEMSLVGPRPERPEFVQVLANRLDGYMDRCLVRPGITGLAQVNLPPDTDLHSVARKLVLDLEYIESASPWLETRLVLCTATRVFKISTVRLLGLRRHVYTDDAMSQHAPAAVDTVVVPTNAITQRMPVGATNGHSSSGQGTNGNGSNGHTANGALHTSSSPDDASTSWPRRPR